jgi:beta-lactamase regulating signal transducer with metallopeptidase domain
MNEFLFGALGRGFLCGGIALALGLALPVAPAWRCRIFRLGIMSLFVAPFAPAILPEVAVRVSMPPLKESSAGFDLLAPFVLAAMTAGLALVMVRHVAGARRLREIVGSARRSPYWESVAARVARTRVFEVPGSPNLPVPSLAGLWKPSILLPADSRQWSPALVRAALFHELAHLRRRDVAWQCLARFACALFWMNPVVWLLSTALRREQEFAADALAATWSGSSGKDYARHLLDIAGLCASPMASGTILAAPMLGKRSGLEARVRRAIIRPPNARRAAALGILAFTVAIGMVASASLLCPKPPKNPDSPWTPEEIELRHSANPFPGAVGDLL